MRILSFVLRSVLILGAVAVIGGLVAREVLLIWAAAQLQTDLQSVRQALKDGEYAKQCVAKGATVVEGEQVAVAQVRFNDATHYDVEIICARYQLEPNILKSATLPPFVRKLPGSSGVTVGTAYSGVVLSIFGRQQVVSVEDEAVKSGGSSDAISVGSGPAATCTGYGFTCCALETEIGTGQQVTQAQDCPRSCYSACQRRPVLLSLTADPYIDTQTRTTTLEGDQPIVVNYVIQPGAAAGITLHLDFGDGTVEQSTTVTGSFTHTYQCAHTSCQYTARSSIVDSTGVTAADAVYSSFTVLVQH